MHLFRRLPRVTAWLDKHFYGIMLVIFAGMALAFTVDRAARRGSLPLPEQATVVLDSEVARGSGVVIAPNLILTARHITRYFEGETVRVLFANRSTYHMPKVLLEGPGPDASVGDWAIVFAPTPTVERLPCLDTERPVLGDELFALGAPVQFETPLRLYGRVSAPTASVEWGLIAGTIVMQGASGGGASGGGVYDERGCLRGVLVASAPFTYSQMLGGVVPSPGGEVIVIPIAEVVDGLKRYGIDLSALRR